MLLDSKRMSAIACLFGLFATTTLSGTAAAEEIDCSDPQDQATMNQCAYLDWQAADAELNNVWKVVRAKMKEVDSYQSEDLKGAEKALLKSQRAWLDYRDGTCETEGFQARGGTLEPLIYNNCLARLTRNRIKEFGIIGGSLEGREN